MLRTLMTAQGSHGIMAFEPEQMTAIELQVAPRADIVGVIP